ncbi:hypothetical protein COU53_03975 [Candidatus Pacearchaeota archaeon CG10_big_fil_rev_8_21_14_0_10_30_48]|nr:MAG: hypothetical protein COU53_03975 [Candidatus Pacearchaeota archaeon CG10_big_fil_rev_8_21_14_0_10_30_48]
MIALKIPKKINYKKYRWFVTSSDKLVVGGKSAEQNEELVKMCMKGEHLDLESRASLEEWTNKKKKYIVMHTNAPGSPFSIILDENPNQKDLDETAIFTASFSRAWRELKKEVNIDVFLLEQMYKEKGMKVGTFGVLGKRDVKKVPLKLYFKKQSNILRAVPFEIKNSPIIIPGKIPKEKFAMQISEKFKVSLKEAINSLPTGNFDFFIPVETKKKTKIKTNLKKKTSTKKKGNIKKKN